MTNRRKLRWSIALVFALTVAVSTDVGPVLVRLPGWYHGVHLGDVLAVAIAAAWVVLGDPNRSRGKED